MGGLSRPKCEKSLHWFDCLHTVIILCSAAMGSASLLVWSATNIGGWRPAFIYQNSNGHANWMFRVRKLAATSNQNHNTSSESSLGWKSYDPNELSGGARYGLCISSVVPRPVGVVTTVSSVSDAGGIVNCAPFSYTSLSSHDPPIVTHGIGLLRGGEEKKDTLVNIEATGEWVFNVLTKSYLEEANACSASLPYDVDETEETGLETLPCELVAPPRLAKAAISMECKLWDKKEVFNDEGAHTTTIVMGRVVRFHIHDSVLKYGQPDDNPLVDLIKLQAVGRAGDITYWPHGVLKDNTLQMTRPK